MVSGFLGSGKTTLIGRLLRHPGYARTAVIVNEFGEVGLDHDLIASAGETVALLPGGCLCCMVRTDLADTLLDLRRRRDAGELRFDRVLIETSGLADPAPILHALMTEPAVREWCAAPGLATLVDCVHGEQTLRRHPEARRQVALADRLLFSKTDLQPPSDALRASVAGLNGGVAAVVAGPDPELFFSAGAEPVGGRFDPVSAVHGEEIGSCLVQRSDPVPALALTLLLQALVEHCGARLLRVKGLVWMVEMPDRPAVVQCVRHVLAPIDFLPAWPGCDRHTRLVVIGEGIPRHLPARLLDAIVAEVAGASVAEGLR